ncbi:prohibitin family protein [Meiothermus taiwanensis]|jgi:prohibitin 2|uniref:HflC protein n=2 Tax=Meiothermus taiwanensis TaxID=172827 RepID=A0A399E4U3_9DEIN|nr:prohibitin family protein [Meiothermus taiwanensis]AWR85863.1 band 7 protein [Meiothermus taiwanensis WR-220]KIQ53339.1 membrane protease subunit, stomatin/prohibitin [Meiothermus taiwanensis]KZK16608.1 membrane protease subunit, stomatin/prohibitin [Meiothermus taiwanensis]RIH79744.1 HflC protein [Meiothermus taiwanensis]
MFLLLGIVVAILGIVLLAQPGGRRALGAPLLLVGLAIVAISQSFVVVPAGHVGVVFNVFGGVQPTPLGEGFRIVIPGIQSVVLYDARLKEVTLAKGPAPAGTSTPGEDAITARSKEGLDIGVDVTVQYRIKREEAPQLHRNLGPGYLETLIVPQIRSKVRDAVGLFNAAELISTQRTQLEAAVTKELREDLGAQHIELISVLLRRIDIPPSVAKVIEEKQTAEQQVQVEINRRQQAEIAAQRAVVQAKGERDAAILRAEGEAQAIRLRGEALRQSPQVIQLTVAEKLAPNIQTIMVPTTGNFLLDLRSLQQAQPAQPAR